jgi:hypothetical protein
LVRGPRPEARCSLVHRRARCAGSARGKIVARYYIASVVKDATIGLAYQLFPTLGSRSVSNYLVMRPKVTSVAAFCSASAAWRAAYRTDGLRPCSSPAVCVARPDWGGIASLGSEPLPLVVFEQPCVFRAAGVVALDKAGIAWRLAFTSPSLAGLWAAAEAGFGVTLRTGIGVPKALAALETGSVGLPSLPTMPLSLHQAEKEPTAGTTRLAEILRETIAERIGDTAG